MYALTVRFILKGSTDWSTIPDLMRQRAEILYRNIPGLVSKAFLYDPENREYGGNYVWRTKGDLEAFLSSEIFRAAKERLGEPKTLQVHRIEAYLDSGLVYNAVTRPVPSVAE